MTDNIRSEEMSEAAAAIGAIELPTSTAAIATDPATADVTGHDYPCAC